MGKKSPESRQKSKSRSQSQDHKNKSESKDLIQLHFICYIQGLKKEGQNKFVQSELIFFLKELLHFNKLGILVKKMHALGKARMFWFLLF